MKPGPTVLKKDKDFDGRRGFINSFDHPLQEVAATYGATYDGALGWPAETIAVDLAGNELQVAIKIRGSVPMLSAAELSAGGSGDGQYGADDEDDDADRPDDRDLGDEADDQQDDPDNNHGVPLCCTRVGQVAKHAVGTIAAASSRSSALSDPLG